MFTYSTWVTQVKNVSPFTICSDHLKFRHTLKRKKSNWLAYSNLILFSEYINYFSSAKWKRKPYATEWCFLNVCKAVKTKFNPKFVKRGKSCVSCKLFTNLTSNDFHQHKVKPEWQPRWRNQKDSQLLNLNFTKSFSHFGY